jgi:hypothetical protein
MSLFSQIIQTRKNTPFSPNRALSFEILGYLITRSKPRHTPEAAVQTAYRVNVGNLRDTGYSTQRTPLAAKVQYRSLLVSDMTDGLGR